MEQKIDELLSQLHRFLFADSDQIVNELRLYIIDHSLKEADLGTLIFSYQIYLAFVTSKIFNSKLSILEFLRQNTQSNERLLASVKKRLYELVIEFLKFRQQEAAPYLQQIKDACLYTFRSDSNSLVRESSLKLLLFIIENYNHTEIESIIKPTVLISMMLDEIKLKRPSASVKGTIWTMVGVLHEKYVLEEFRVESQDVMFIQLMEQMKSEKPEIKAITGIMKGMVSSFMNECTLDEGQLEQLFVCLKIAVQPIEGMNNKGVIKAGMKLLGTHINLFKKNLTKYAIEFVTLTLSNLQISIYLNCIELCVHDNMDVRDGANEMLGRIMQQISEGLTTGDSIHKDIFKTIISKFQEILEDANHANILLISTIKAVGIFSKAIQTFMGDDQLWKYLERLIELSESKLIQEFDNQEDPNSDMKNFKQILKKQKQLISFIESYSFIVGNLVKPPSDDFLIHFFKICQIGVRHHRKLYAKYRTKFYDALAFFTMSLTKHKHAFTSWIKKFIQTALVETLKIPDSVIFGGESPFESLQDAVQFWRDWLTKDQIWTDFTCKTVYEELIFKIQFDLEHLNLNYKVEKGKVNKDDNKEVVLNEQYTGMNKNNVVSYIATNNNDQQYLVRLSNFVEMFLIECKDEWFLEHACSFSTVIIRKASETPRISKLYSLLKIAMQICSKYKYFDNLEDKKVEKLNFYNMLISFFKDLVGKQEEYQDELLISCLDLLLHVPISILYLKDKQTDNIHLWRGVMIKALEIGHTNNQLAMKSVIMLEQWFNALPIQVTVNLYKEILPKLSAFLYVENQVVIKKENAESFFLLEMLKSGNEIKVDRKDISYKVLDLLGKIGGHAHNIINNEQTKLVERENFIKWDPEKKIKFTIPLYNKKIDIYFDSCLPRLIDLAQNSTDRDTRIAAGEFLYALILYMIGKNATQVKGRHNKDIEDIAPFAKIYAKLFPVIIKLATEIEQQSRQLFEMLVFQIVRWFSSSRVQDHPEIESLLDALIEGASSRNNSALRELCSNAVAEFAKWSLKQMSDKDILENPVNIKSLIRRIESNSNHPDPFKRLSSVLCFNKIFTVLREFDPLIDRFVMEIAHCVLQSLKMCHNAFEFSQEVIENCSKLLERILKVMTKKSAILLNKNSKRSIHPNLYVFIIFIFEDFTSIEKIYRRESMKLWDSLVRNLPPNNSEQMPDKPSKWILDFYIKKRGDRQIFNRLQRVEFEEQKNEGQQLDKKQVMADKQKQLDILTAQLECFEYLLSKVNISYGDMVDSKVLNENLMISNIFGFITTQIVPKFKKNKSKSIDKLLVCKEDREQLTKSKIQLITQLFKFLNALDSNSQRQVLQKLEKGNNFNMLEFAIQILLIPIIHNLQVLVEDQELERTMRNYCETFIKNQIGNVNLLQILKQNIIQQLPIVDIDLIKPNNVQSYNPKVLMSMCLGYLKLSLLDPKIKLFLIEKVHLTEVIEQWLQGDTPLENESARVIVKFISKLVIPNQVLAEWLTIKVEVYQKTSDLLLTYIAENWDNQKLNVGEYLIHKTNDDKSLLAVFIPILEIVSKKTPNYQQTLLKHIPVSWIRPFEEYQYAMNSIKIYSFIAVHCKSQLLDRSNKLSTTFIAHTSEIIKHFLVKPLISAHLRAEVLNLAGFMFNFQMQNGEFVHQRIDIVLRSLQNTYFPIKTAELKKGSNQYINFQIIIEAFLNLLVSSKNLKVLRLLYKVIREEKTSFDNSFKKNMNIVVMQNINVLPLPEFLETVDQFIQEFLNYNTDTKIDGNLRWAIADKIILKILETCNITYLIQFMIKYTQQLVDRLKNPSHYELRERPAIEFYSKVREQTFIFLIFDIMFRRLTSDQVKNEVHKKLYGAQSQGNELTKTLISICSPARKHSIEHFIQKMTGEGIVTELPQYNAPAVVQRMFICAAYSCLTSIVMKTQTKENMFSQFLFITQRDKGEEPLLSLLIDSEMKYNFEVETNFSYIQLKSIEKQLEVQNADIAQIRANNLISDYVNHSFMSTYEKFNSAMVFETLPDKLNMKSEEDKLQSLLNNKVKEGEEEEQKDEEKSERMELDNVNKHPCMMNMKLCIDKMEELFQKQWEEDRSQMPLFMQALNAEMKREETHINVKIFILKLIVNNPSMFSPYAQFWFEPIARYIIEKNNGGSGFHYFMRDLCTLLISWNHYTPEDSSKNKVLCTQVVNTLIKFGADKTKMIFNTNIQIIATLLHRWKKLIALNKDLLHKMIATPDSKESSHLWKMTGIQIIALAVSFDIPVLDNPEQITQIAQNQKQFKLEEEKENPKGDKLLAALLEIQLSKKKQIIYAASETLGKILNHQPLLMGQAVELLMKNESKDRHDVFVNVLERVSRDYNGLLQERTFFLKLTNLVNSLTGSMRSAIFKTFERYLSVCRQKQKLVDIDSITESLYSVSDQILADISDENQQSFLSLLFQITKLNTDTGEKLLQKVIPRLKQLFAENKNDYSRGLFYDIMVYLYDQHPAFRGSVKSALIRGLSDKSKVIRDKIVTFWSDQTRLGFDPLNRLQQIMSDLYIEEEEGIWLNNAVYLLFQISTNSSDYERLIFEQPLKNCKFHPLEISHFNNNFNRSQPFTPILSQMESLFQASQALQDKHQLSIIPKSENEEMKGSQEEEKELRGKMKKIIIEDSQQMDIDSQGGVIRATQVPVFTQTQSEISSLIATNFISNSPIDASISASFYDINKQKKKGNSGFTVMKVGAQDRNDDLFQMPMQKKKGKTDLSNFLHKNQLSNTQMESQGDKIRIVPQGSMTQSKPNHQEMYNRQMQRNKQNVNLLRKYRQGELPDIQRTYQDFLLPLMALIKVDQTIATEVFVEVFSEIYKGVGDQQTKDALGDGIKGILNRSVKYDYGAINCMHRIAMELLKIDGFTVSSDIIQRTGTHSMSYQTSIILLEETILHGQDLSNAEYEKALQQPQAKKMKMNEKAKVQKVNNSDLCKITDSNKSFWFNLINMYEHLGNDDVLQGIWCLLGDEEEVLFTKKEGGSQNQGVAVNLIKNSHSLKAKGQVNESLQLLEDALKNPLIYQEFDAAIQLELENQRYEAKTELLKWEDVAKDLSAKWKGKKLNEIPFSQAQNLIKAEIRLDEYWGELTSMVEFWQSDSVSKSLFYKNFNFEHALVALTGKDFDRARFYVDREVNELFNQWKNLTKLSQIAQHILVQKIQKIYEMKEFLSLVKNEGIMHKQEIIPKIMNSVGNWIQRTPSNAFDKLIVWDDILNSRIMYLDLFQFRFQPDFKSSLDQSHELNDIRAILHVQCAKGAYQMGLLDTCDKYLKKAFNLRQQQQYSNMKIVVPIIKLKSQQFKNEVLNLSYQDKAQKLLKIIGILEGKMKEQNANNKDDVKIEVKALILKQYLEKKMLNIMLEGAKNVSNDKQLQTHISSYLGKNFESLNNIMEKVKTAAGFNYQMKQLEPKIHFRYAQFTDKILRKCEVEKYQQYLKNGLNKIQKNEVLLAKETIKHGLQSLNLEYSKASDIIPRLLDVVSTYKQDVEGVFIAYAKDTPPWFFLRWINQIVAVVNRSESSVIEEKVLQIARKYPQALYYPFKVVESNIQVSIMESQIETTSLFKKLSKYFNDYFKNLNSWIAALDCLIFPEHRFKYWYQMINDMCSDNSKQVDQSKFQSLVKMLISDLAITDKPLIGDKIGSYNQKFADKWGKHIVVLGKSTDQSKILSQLNIINQKMSEQIGSLGQGYEKLSTYSGWLDAMDCNDFYNQFEYIELPGQYESLVQAPVIEKNVKIASIRKTLLVLGSIRRPKRITIHGSNEKDYHLLVKGGEDLRLDQRVEQLFQIMNSIFKDDAYCQNRDLYIKTFNVVPITNRLGTLEWVDNTEPMKSLINKEHIRSENGRDLNSARALAERRKWLRTIPGNQKKENIVEQHLALLIAEDKFVVDGFNKQKDMMPWYLLRNGLENLCLNSSAFLTIKNQFIKSLATFSIASYIIGIGDRHLENFLIDTSDGEILGIDFGIAFGSGVHLGIPELIPFRLTQQIEGVIAPHPLEGSYKQTMVHALTAIRKRKSLILDTCEIFVKEPLLDWVKDAKMKISEEESKVDSQAESAFDIEMDQISWYPRKKIEIVKQKLDGRNPARVIVKELKDSKHEKKKYIRTILKALEGPEDSLRHSLIVSQKRYLDVDEQIDCLIEQARDPNILGRTWIGWSPYI